MRIVKQSFPHPVLSPGRDDIAPNVFDLRCNCHSDSKSYLLDYELDYANAGLTQKVASGEAVHALYVECRDGYYRRLFKTPARNGRVEISVDDLCGTVEVMGFIVAATPMAEYKIPDAHTDYEGVTFPIRQGDILAITKTFTFPAIPNFDPLKKVSSIMQVLKGDPVEGPFTADLDQDKISVWLSQFDYKCYVEARHDPRVASLIIQGIVLPILVHAVANAAARDKGNEPLPRWAQIVKQRLTAQGHKLADADDKALVQAQSLLPTTRFLRDLIRLTDGETNEPQIFD